MGRQVLGVQGGWGTVFAVNTDGTGFTNLHTFTDQLEVSDAGLTLSGSVLYGVTTGGVFAVNTNGTGFTNLCTFDGADAQYGGLILSGNTLYGMEGVGGISVAGSVFSINTDGTDFTYLYGFPGGDGGGVPYAGLMLSGNTLYGTTSEDYAFGGTLFAVDTNGTGFTNLYHFTGGMEGSYPEAVLIISGNTLYGTTLLGGISNWGTIFAINTDGTGFTNLYAFTNLGEGFYPNPELVLSGNTLYGTTGIGGSGASGTIFSLTFGLASAPQGSLQVTIDPLDVVNAGAQWQVDGGASQASGATVTNLSKGNHDVSFTTVSGWNTPADQTVTITSGATATATGFYTPIGNGVPGSLSVMLQPAGAVSAGAQWNVDGGASQASGATVADLTAGNHSLSFTSVPGWGTPAGQIVTIASGLTSTSIGYYTVLANGQTGALSVTIQPGAADFDGARWRVDGGASQTSGTTVTNLSTGSHSVLFTPVSGWTTPAGKTVTVINGTTTTVTGLYTPSITPSNGLILLTNGFGAIQHGGWPKSLVIGKQYKITAVPKPKNVFVNWVGGTSLSYSVLSASASYTFTMQSNLVLEANFSTNVFFEAQGVYKGLFTPTNSIRQQGNSGSFSFNVASSGTVSGTFALGGQVVPFSGKFSVGGAAEIVVKRPRGESSLTATLQLDLADQSVAGTISDGTFTAVLKGDHDVFSASHKATEFEGQYTLVIPGTNDSTVGPFGFSYATVKVDALGNITLAGSLADGTTISQSSVVSKDGHWPLYVNLYGGKGSLWSWNYFTTYALMASPALSWINAGNSARTALYRSGFTNQQAMLTGGSYVSSQFLPAGLIVTLQGGDLPLTITTSNSLETVNKLVLKTNLTTGLVSGSFADPNEPKQMIKVNGVILQGQRSVDGYFLGTDQSGSFTIHHP